MLQWGKIMKQNLIHEYYEHIYIKNIYIFLHILNSPAHSNRYTLFNRGLSCNKKATYPASQNS